MHKKLALFLSCLHIGSVLAGEGETYRFSTADQLERAGNGLQYAFIIFRHGIRSPISNIYGSDEEFLKKWPDDKGGLTEEGKRLMVHVGQSLKTRYSNLVPDYDKEIVEVTSTLSPRATMSAYSVAAGMFPPPEVLIEDIPSWQPVPVYHTAGYDKYYLFDEMQGKTKCARYVKIRDSIVPEEMKRLNKKQTANIKKINSKLATSKSPIKTIKTLDDLFNVWDVYFMEQLSEKTSEPWTQEFMPNFIDIAQFRLWSRMHSKNDGPNSILQYFTGPFLNQILLEMVKKSTDCIMRMLANTPPYNENQPLCRPRLHLHGSHDLTVGALVWALTNNVKQEKFMAYPGDALIIEMYNDQLIKMFLYSPLKAEKERFKPMSLKGLCGEETCRYEPLVKSLKSLGLSYTEEEWKQKCDNLNGAENTQWRKIPS